MVGCGIYFGSVNRICWYIGCEAKVGEGGEETSTDKDGVELNNRGNDSAIC